MLVYFFQGKLPWQGQQAASLNQQQEIIQGMKIATPLHILCKGLPRKNCIRLIY